MNRKIEMNMRSTAVMPRNNRSTRCSVSSEPMTLSSLSKSKSKLSSSVPLRSSSSILHHPVQPVRRSIRSIAENQKAVNLGASTPHQLDGIAPPLEQLYSLPQLA